MKDISLCGLSQVPMISVLSSQATPESPTKQSSKETQLTHSGLTEVKIMTHSDKEILFHYVNKTLGTIDRLRHPDFLVELPPFEENISNTCVAKSSKMKSGEAQCSGKMSSEDELRYPKFAEFVDELKEIEHEDKTVWKALKDVGGFNDSSLRKALDGKNNPHILIQDSEEHFPAWHDPNHPDALFINSKAAQAFEKGTLDTGNDVKPLTGDNLKLWSESYVLHEMVHYGEFHNKPGEYKKSDINGEFNKWAYGEEVITPYSRCEHVWDELRKRRGK